MRASKRRNTYLSEEIERCPENDVLTSRLLREKAGIIRPRPIPDDFCHQSKPRRLKTAPCSPANRTFTKRP